MKWIDLMNVREKAVVLLSENEKNGGFINLSLNEALKENFSDVDKSLLTILVNGTLQKKILLDFYLKKYVKKDYEKTNVKIKNILRISCYQILFMDRIPPSAAINEGVKIAKKFKGAFMGNFVNAVLRSISREKDMLLKEEIPSEINSLVPKYIYDIWALSYGETVANTIAENMQTIPKTTIVLNLAKFKKEEILSDLKKEKIEIDENLNLKTPIDLTTLETFKKGEFFVQGNSSKMACKIINAKENEKILDLCAAPGGKTFNMQISADNKAYIVACDLKKSKTDMIRKTANRLNLKIDVLENDATILREDFLGKFDKVLCDVPCSGFGSIKKKRDIINKEQSDFNELIEIQQKILENSAKYLKVGGTLFYSTCTLNARENEENIQKFIENNKNFKIISIKDEFLNAIPCKIYTDYVTILPSIDYDGFFIAKLRKEK
ncbi:MAG: 16S rRNA (cytosine(967)-C(5))-methyltransferase RsmB [Clostridia bacterium]